ncbi:MAG: MoaD/ThiS family protein [Elusimicrobiota bacterium]
MKVDIKIIGTLIRPFGKDVFRHECAGGATLLDLLRDLNYSERHIPHIMASVNGELKHHDAVINDDDAVTLSVTVGGG